MEMSGVELLKFGEGFWRVQASHANPEPSLISFFRYQKGVETRRAASKAGLIG